MLIVKKQFLYIFISLLRSFLFKNNSRPCLSIVIQDGNVDIIVKSKYYPSASILRFMSCQRINLGAFFCVEPVFYRLPVYVYTKNGRKL